MSPITVNCQKTQSRQVYSYPGNVLMKLIICLIDDFYTSYQPTLSDTKSKKQWSNVYKRTPILLWEIKNFKRAKYFLNDTIFSDLKELGWYNAYWWRSLQRKDDNLIWNIHSGRKRFVYFSFKTLHNFSCIYYNRNGSFFFLDKITHLLNLVLCQVIIKREKKRN